MSMLFKRIKDWATSITTFRSGDVIPVDGPSGTAKMTKDDLLKEAAKNALGSIHSLSDTATEDDLVSGNYLALDGTNGTKKLPANNIPPKSVQDNLVANTASAFNPSKANGADGYAYHKGDKVEYNGRFYIFTENRASGAWTGKDVSGIDIGLVADTILNQSLIELEGISVPGTPGTIVRQNFNVGEDTDVYVKIPSALWSYTSITTPELYILTCGYVDSENVPHDVKGYTINTLPSHVGETITLPKGYTKYYICMRGDAGEKADFVVLEKRPLYKEIRDASGIITRKTSITVVGSGGTAVVNQIPLYGKCDVSVKMPSSYPVESVDDGQYVLVIGYYTAVTDRDNPRTGVKYVTKPILASYIGKTISVSIPEMAKSLFLFARCDEGNTLQFDVEINQRQEDEVVGASEELRDVRLTCVKRVGAMTYGAGRSPMYVEETNTSNGSIYFKCTNLVGRGSIDCGWTMGSLATALNVSLVVSPNGESNCIAIQSGYVLCIGVDNVIALKSRSDVVDTDVRILSCIDGLVSDTALDQYYMARLRKLDESVKDNVPKYTDGPNDNYAENLTKVTDECDSFLFFSDPHSLGLNGTITDAQYNRFKNIVTLLVDFAKANSVERILCGGDMLNSGDTQQQAMKKLGYFKGICKKIIGDVIIAEGNHDTNYQGKLDDSSAENTGLFTIPQQVASMFQQEGACYYHKSSATTDYYILDTGLDTDFWEMNEYRWRQVDWLANAVLSAKTSHGIIMMHAFAADANDWSRSFFAIARNVQSLCGAINGRTSITLNGITYDFSGVTQKIAVILCGHTHIDYVDDTGNVPVVAITNTDHDTQYAIDACVVDYAAGKLYATRIGGYGSDRSVDIVV